MMGESVFTVNWDEIPWYSKLELAEHQLERAITLFLDEKDYISSITLAGASEEILGKLLIKNGQEHELKGLENAFALEYGQGWEEHKTWLTYDANYYRDNLKHLEPKPPKGDLPEEANIDSIPIYPEAAIKMIDRALVNYWKVTGKQSKNMIRYYNVRG